MLRACFVTNTLLSLVCALACSKKTEKEPPASEPVVEEGPVTTSKGPQVEPKPVTYDLSPEQQKAIFETPVQSLMGEDSSLGNYKGKSLMIVNVASECGLTPQYEKLQALQDRYGEQGFTVVGFPSNQFGGQEPGTPEEILAFGREKYKVSFPLMEKVDTNGEKQHPIYTALTSIKDAKGEAGDVQWNFEKFFVSGDGTRITRIRSEQSPDDPEVVELIEADLQKD